MCYSFTLSLERTGKLNVSFYYTGLSRI
ncbi:antitoxin YezG family protein [Bacillus inaquosorum]|nr:antitoxin YezG family protein [Bacillus inaquosorum]